MLSNFLRLVTYFQTLIQFDGYTRVTGFPSIAHTVRRSNISATRRVRVCRGFIVQKHGTSVSRTLYNVEVATVLIFRLFSFGYFFLFVFKEKETAIL